MILVEISVPALVRRYDFELEETVKVSVLIREMIEVICQREHIPFTEGEQGFSLYQQDMACRLNTDGTLEENGVCGGQRLILA